MFSSQSKCARQSFLVFFLFLASWGWSTNVQVLTQDVAGVGFNDTTPVSPIGGNTGQTLGEQRLIAVQWAADLWGGTVNSSVTIKIVANFSNLPCTPTEAVLALAGPGNIARDFSGGLPGTWYPGALADALSGQNLNSNTAEIELELNLAIGSGCLGGVTWYLGLDGNPGSNMDMVTTVLHELAHGLGFTTTVNLETGTLFTGYKDIYGTFLEDHSTGKLWMDMNNAERASSAIDTNDLHWTGAQAIAAASGLFGGVHPSGHLLMHAPNPLTTGASVTHLSGSFSPDQLLESNYSGVNQKTGLARDMLMDMGWNTTQQADLELSGTAGSSQVNVGSTFPLTLYLHNNGGPGKATTILVETSLSDELQITNAAGDGSFDLTSGIWTIPEILANNTKTIVLTILVSSSGYPVFGAELMNTGQIDPDSTPGNGVLSEDDQFELLFTGAQLLSNGSLVNDIEGGQGSWRLFRLDVPAGQQFVSMSTFGGRGDLDLYLRKDEAPTTTNYDIRSLHQGNLESTVFELPLDGSWYVGVYGFLDFEGANLMARYSSDDLRIQVNRTLRANCPQITIELTATEGGAQAIGATEFLISENGQTPFPPSSILEISAGNYQLTYTTSTLHGGDVFPVVSLTYNGKESTDFGLFNNCTPSGSRIQTWIDRDYRAYPGYTVLVPIEVEAIEQGFQVNSFEIDLSFDKDVLEFDSLVQDNSLVEDWDLVYANGSIEGKVLISAASTSQIELEADNPSVLLGILFRMKSDVTCGSCSEVRFDQVVYNDGSPGAATEPGQICFLCGSGGTPYADLELLKTASQTSLLPGETIDFTLKLKNIGPNGATGVSVSDLLPSGVSFQSATGAGSYSPQTGVWQIGTVYPQTEVQIILSTRATQPGNYTNTAEVRTSNVKDPDSTPHNGIPTEDDISDVSFTVLSPGNADLSLTKTVDVSNPKVGEHVTFTLTVSNDGPDTAQGVQVIDRYLNLVPYALIFNSASGDGSFDSETGVWTLDPLENGSSAVYDLEFVVASHGPVTNRAEVFSCNQNDPDSTPNNQNSAEDDDASASITPQSADLTFQVSASDTTPLLNDTVTLTYQLTNNGPDPAVPTARITIPSGLNYLSDTSSGSYQIGAGNWAPGALNSGANASFTMDCQVSSTQPQTVSGEVTFSDQADPDSSPNNHITSEDDYDEVILTPQIADLELTLSADNLTPGLGDQISVTCHLENKGPHQGTGVSVHFEIPGEFSYISDDAGGAYSSVTQTWTVGNIDTTIPTILVLVFSKDIAGKTEINAEVSSSETFDPDSTPGNGIIGEDDDDSLGFGSADLSLSSEASNLLPEIGSMVILTLTVSNDGPDDVSQLEILAHHPSDLLFQESAGDGTYDHASRTWSLNQNIASGQSVSIDLTYKVYGYLPKAYSAEINYSDLFDPDSTPGNLITSEDDYSALVLTPECGTGSTITVLNGDSPGEGFNDTRPTAPVGGNSGTTLGEQRMIAFQHAADIWASFLSSSVEIVVEAHFDPLTCSASSAILGSAGPNSVARNFQGAPLNQTWYPAALANSLAGSDLQIESPDVSATFNSSIDNNNNCLSGKNWYYGLDGDAGSNMDFVTVLLHEMGHGLGFLTLVNGTTGAKFMDMNDVYMLYLESHPAGQPGKTWPELGNSARVASAISGADLHFNGPNLTSTVGDFTAGVSGGHVEMFAPNPYQQGSSVSHFSTSLSPNELMEPYYTGPNHGPGHALDLFLDIGWGCQQEHEMTADLELGIIPETDQPLLDEPLMIQLQLVNQGPDSASNITVEFAIPDGLTFVSNSGAGTYDEMAGIWSLNGIQSGQTQVQEIHVTVNTLDGIPLIAELMTSDQFDSDSTPGNGEPSEDDYATVELAPILEPVADLSLGGTLSDNLPQPGEQITLILSLHNRGTQTAQNPIVHLELPSGLDFVSSGPGYNSGTGMWTPGPIATGITLDLTLTLDVTTTGNMVIRSQVQSSDLPDPDSTPGNGYIGEDDDWTGDVYGQPDIPDCTDCANIILDITDSEGEGFLDNTPVSPIGGNTGETLGEQRIIAFEHAVKLFCNLLEAKGDIVASASFDPLLCTQTTALLGYGSPAFAVRDFLDAPISDTWYPGSLANSFSGVDQNSNEPEILAVFNSNIDSPEILTEPGPCTDSSEHYVVEIKRSKYIKFENSPVGLGEDHTYMKDTFEIHVSGATNSVLVGLKASTVTREVLLTEGDSVLIGALGFRVTCTSITGPVYKFEVESPCNPHALSHIYFDFGQGNITYPTGNSYFADRTICENGWSVDCDPPDTSNNCIGGIHWYYGLDGIPGNRLDFVTAVLHEMTHGLGFMTYVDLDPSSQGFGSKFMGKNDTFMRHLEDHSTGLHWSEMTNTERVYSATDTNDLHWTGPAVTEQSGQSTGGVHSSGHVKMYAPHEINVGSSVTHWDPTLSPNELLEPHYFGAKHNLGLAGEALWDVGWGRFGCVDLELAMDVDNDTPNTGDFVTFTLDLVNQGPRGATQIVVKSLTGPGFVFQSYSGDGTFDDSTGLWTVGSLTAGQEAGLDLVFQVQSGSKKHIAEVYSVDQPDQDSIPNNGNPGEDDYARLSLGLADLSMVISAPLTEYTQEEEFSVTFEVSNNGPDDVSGVITSLSLPSSWVITHEDSAGFFNSSTGIWDVDQIATSSSRSLIVHGFFANPTSVHFEGEVQQSDLGDPDSTPGNGVIGEDDDSSLDLEIAAPLGDLAMDIQCVTPATCPQTKMRLYVTRSGVPQDGLVGNQFEVTLDSEPIITTFAAGSEPGTYELGFELVEPDGGTHALNATLEDQTHLANASTLFTACNAAGCTVLRPQETLQDISGQQAQWRCYRIEIPANQSSLSVQSFFGSGDCDLYVRRDVQPTLQSYDKKSTQNGNEEDITIPYPTGGVWYIGMYGFGEYCNASLRADWFEADLGLDLRTIFTSSCPMVSLEVLVTRDQLPVSWLEPQDFILREDGFQVNLDSVTQNPAGTYTLSFTTPRPDSQSHDIEVLVSVSGHVLSSSSSYQNCLGDCYELQNNVVVDKLSGIGGSWRCFYIDVPSNQDALEVSTFGGMGDGDLFLKFGSQPTPIDFDLQSNQAGNLDFIQVDHPSEGRWYVGLKGISTYRDLNLLAKYYIRDLLLDIQEVSIANCPDIHIRTQVTLNNLPVTSLNSSNFILNEENQLSTIQEATHLGSGVYDLVYRTLRTQGQETNLVLEVGHDGKQAWANDMFENCTRQGGALDVWINREHAGPAGGAVSIPVQISPVIAGFFVESFEFELEYDPSILIFTSVSKTGSLISSWQYLDDSGSTPGHLLITANSGGHGFIESSQEETLVYLNFEVDEMAAIGECSPLSFVEEFVEDAFRFNEGIPVALTSDGLFCVSSGCFGAIGDVDRDGNASEAWDALQIIRQISGIPTVYDPIPICIADTNCSGTIALIDPILILQRSVLLINGYCQSSKTRSVNDFQITVPEITVAPGTAFELEIMLDQLPPDPVYGYSFDMNFDPDQVAFSGVSFHESTLTERWAEPLTRTETGGLTLTQYNPFSALEQTGTLLKLRGFSGFELTTTSITFTRFSLAANSEPEQVFGPFPLHVQGTLCFDLNLYHTELASWGTQPDLTVIDLINRISCN